jgi:catechol 2,3-dioxygenase-like lactoylglutathione lyase family enzyme
MRLALLLAASAASLCAQLAPPNASGVSIGHVHIMSPDPDAQKKIFVDVLGAQVVHAGTLELLKLPGVYIIAGKARTPTVEGSDGSSIPHYGFLMKSYAEMKPKLAAAGVTFATDNEKNHQLMAKFPDNILVEFTEDPTMTIPVKFHHIHIATPDGDAGRDWYVKTFGAKGGMRATFQAANLPGGEVDFRKSDAPMAPTKGRALDHIGFEVKDLEAFCKKLEANGVKFEVPYRVMPQLDNLKLAFLVDPFGVRIELTEGLAGR